MLCDISLKSFRLSHTITLVAVARGGRLHLYSRQQFLANYRQLHYKDVITDLSFVNSWFWLDERDTEQRFMSHSSNNVISDFNEEKQILKLNYFTYFVVQL